ncbi:MAG: hypothetical protein WCK42_01740 [Myxococcaceae bacterium]
MAPIPKSYDVFVRHFQSVVKKLSQIWPEPQIPYESQEDYERAERLLLMR